MRTMNRALTGATMICALALGACSGQPATQTPQSQSVPAAAATISAAVLSPADLAKLQNGCAAAGPLLTAATLPIAPAAVSGTALYAASYCQQLAAAPAGTVPATTDTSTPSWYADVIAGVQVAGEIAKYALPILTLI